MKFDVDDKNRCRLVCVKFHLNRRRFAVAVAKCLGGSLFLGHSVVLIIKSKIITTSVNGLIINDTKKAITININKTPNNRKHHG